MQLAVHGAGDRVLVLKPQEGIGTSIHQQTETEEILACHLLPDPRLKQENYCSCLI